MTQTDNLNIRAQQVLIPPEALKAELPLTESVEQTVAEARADVASILSRQDPRLLVVVGPCSIHDVEGEPLYAGLQCATGS